MSHPNICRQDEFVVACGQDVTPSRVEALLDQLARRGVLLTSYGNVRGADSIVADEEYWRARNNHTCLDIGGIQRILRVLPDCVTYATTWNHKWGSRPLRTVYLDVEEWLLPLQNVRHGRSRRNNNNDDVRDIKYIDSAVLGHGELIAAMLFHGFATWFQPHHGSGCAFKCALRRGILADIEQARICIVAATRQRTTQLLGFSDDEASVGSTDTDDSVGSTDTDDSVGSTDTDDSADENGSGSEDSSMSEEIDPTDHWQSSSCDTSPQTPITSDLKTGDCVKFDEAYWLIACNGSSTYLYKTQADLNTKKHARSVRAEVLKRDGSLPSRIPRPHVRSKKTGASSSPSSVSSTAPTTAKPKKRTPSRFFYVVRDCDLPESDRRLKLGVTGNVPAMLATYRRGVPNSHALGIVDCTTESAARAIEAHAKTHFAPFRVDDSEVYRVRPHEVWRMLTGLGYKQQVNGLFAKVVK